MFLNQTGYPRSTKMSKMICLLEPVVFIRSIGFDEQLVCVFFLSPEALCKQVTWVKQLVREFCGWTKDQVCRRKQAERGVFSARVDGKTKQTIHFDSRRFRFLRPAPGVDDVRRTRF